MKKKIIIIYEKAGGGHKQAAFILAEILASAETEIKVLTPLELISYPFDNFFTTVLVNKFRLLDIQFLSDFVFNFLFRIFIQPWFISFGMSKFVRAIERAKPDILISTISGLNTTFQYSAERLNIPFHIFITVISVHADNFAEKASHLCYFQETADMVRSFPGNTFAFQSVEKYQNWLGKLIYPVVFAFKYGIKREPFFRSFDKSPGPANSLNCQAIGILRRKSFYESIDLTLTKLRKQLGIPLGIPCVLITSGSLGGNFIIKSMKQLRRGSKRNLFLMLLCGKDEKLFRKLSECAGNTDGKLIVLPIRYSENMHLYLRAADIVISRGTCGSFLESLLSRVPIISRGHVDKCDIGVIELIKKYSVGEVFSSDRELVQCLEKVLDNRENYVENIDKFLKQTNSTDYDKISQKVKDLILGKKDNS